MRPRATEKGTNMIDLSVQLSQPTLPPQIWRAFSLQRQIVDDWYQSMDAWRMRRVNGVGATLNLASALSSTRRPQAAIGLWSVWYSGVVARWADDMQDQLRFSQKTMDRLLAAVPSEASVPVEPARPSANSDQLTRHRQAVADHANDWRWGEQHSARYEAA